MNGADEYNLTNALTVLGFKYKMGLHGTFVKLKSILEEGQTPIVHLVMHDGIGHYMVFTGYDEQNVYLADPAKGKIIKYGIPFFMGVWKTKRRKHRHDGILQLQDIVEIKLTVLSSGTNASKRNFAHQGTSYENRGDRENR